MKLLLILIVLSLPLVSAAEYIGTLDTSVEQVIDDQPIGGQEEPDPSSSGGSSSSGGGGGGSSSKSFCTIGTIKCIGELKYQECVVSGSQNVWSTLKDVPAGKICEFGTFTAIEEAVPSEVDVKEELELEKVEEKKLSWFARLIRFLKSLFGF